MSKLVANFGELKLEQILQEKKAENITTVEESKQFRANYNSWANKTFGLMTEREI